MDKRKVYNKSWENLKKGPRVRKKRAKKNAIYNECLNCGKKIKVYPSTKDRKKFCSMECKAEGQSKGLTADMRKGTGRSEEDKMILRKYNRYKQRDNIDFTRDEYIDFIKENSCHYCGSTDLKSLGLDRISNEKDHTKDNVIVACELCNTTRGHRFTVEEMELLGEVIKTFDKDGWRMTSKKAIQKIKKANKELYKAQQGKQFGKWQAELNS